MSTTRPRNRKTLVNELNNAGSTYNRRLNADVVPSISPAYTLSHSTTLESAVSLGSAQNPWRALYCERLLANYPRIIPATNAVTDPPVTGPSGNGGFYWYIAVPGGTEKLYRWSNVTSSWTQQTPLIPGTIFLGSSNARLWGVPADLNMVQGFFQSNAPG